jgi:hypothetical protein
MKVIKTTHLDPLADVTAWNTAMEDHSLYTDVEWPKGANPKLSWVLPFILGESYKVHWRWGVDFTTMKMERSEYFQANEKPVII